MRVKLVGATEVRTVKPVLSGSSKIDKTKLLRIVVAFLFNVPPTAKVIWRRGHGLKYHPTDW